MPLARLLLAISVAAALAAPALAQTPEPWPMVGGDASHAGEIAGPVESFQESGPAPPYVVASRARIPGVLTAPIVADGAVYAVTKDALVRSVAGSGRFDEVASREDGPAGPPAADASQIEGLRTVAFSSGRGKRAGLAFIGVEGPVFSIELQSGERRPVEESLLGSPAVGGITHVESAEGSETPAMFLVGTRDGYLHAVTGPGGSRVWRFKAGGILEGAPAVAGENVIVVAQNLTNGITTVHAVDLATGEEAWRYSPPGVTITASSATVAGDTIVVGFGDLTVRGLDAETGRLRWETRVRGGFSPRMVPIAPDHVFIGDIFGHLYRLDPETGEERWVHRLPGALTFGSPVAVGDHVVVGDRSGQVSAIDTDTGHLVWKHDTGDDDVVGLAADGDALYASIANDGIIAFEHDPAGSLLDEPSPTTLFVQPALVNFAITAVPLYLFLLLLFRMRRGRDNPVAGTADGTATPTGWRES